MENQTDPTSDIYVKWVEDPIGVKPRASGGTTPWTSGTIDKDVPSRLPVPSEAALKPGAGIVADEDGPA